MNAGGWPKQGGIYHEKGCSFFKMMTDIMPTTVEPQLHSPIAEQAMRGRHKTHMAIIIWYLHQQTRRYRAQTH
jgi:hypothetical protein